MWLEPLRERKEKVWQGSVVSAQRCRFTTVCTLMCVPRQNTQLNSSLVSIVLKIPNLALSLGPNIFMWPFSQWLNLSTESNKILLSSQEANGRRAKYMSNRGERNDRTQSRRVNTQQAHLELGVWLGGRRGDEAAHECLCGPTPWHHGH